MSQLDAKFFKPFIDGTINTLKTQCQLDANHGKPFVRGQRSQPKFAIAGVISITSSSFNGTISLCFPEAVFLGILGKMLGESFKEITADVQDGAAELLNIIFGQAKIVLNSQGHTIHKAIPTVLIGKDITSISRNTVMILPFTTEFGEFNIEICSADPS